MQLSCNCFKNHSKSELRPSRTQKTYKTLLLFASVFSVLKLLYTSLLSLSSISTYDYHHYLIPSFLIIIMNPSHSIFFATWLAETFLAQNITFSFTHAHTHSFVHSLTHWPMHTHTQTLIHSLAHRFIHSLTGSLIWDVMCSSETQTFHFTINSILSLGRIIVHCKHMHYVCCMWLGEPRKGLITMRESLSCCICPDV